MWKLSLHGDSQWISLCTQVHTPRDERPIDDYSQRSQALLIPGSRLNGRNSPGARPYCNRQSLKNFADRTKPWKFNTNIFHANFFNVKISRSTVLVSTIHTHVPRLLGALPTLRQGIVSILHACVTWLFVQTNYHRERETFKEENFHKFRDVVHVRYMYMYLLAKVFSVKIGGVSSLATPASSLPNFSMWKILICKSFLPKTFPAIQYLPIWIVSLVITVPSLPLTQVALLSLSPFPLQLPGTTHAMPAARSSLLFCSDASLLASSICFSRAFLLAFLPCVLASLALASANISFSEETSWESGDRDITHMVVKDKGIGLQSWNMHVHLVNRPLCSKQALYSKQAPL